MEKEVKSKKCLYCGSFEGYYTKSLRRFERTTQGICRRKDETVNKEDSCDFWKAGCRRLYIRKRAVSRALYEILTELSAIRQIIQESQDEGKN